MTRALIGSTGFVGGTLLRQTAFERGYHSTDIEQIRGEAFDMVVCAGASAVKWQANRQPEADWASLQRLMNALAEVTAGHLVLISTIDVYADPVGVDEASAPDPTAGSAYGRHRLALEDFVRRQFPSHTILRLPGVFGPGLKKNVIYDLLHDHRVEAISLEAQFQWYPLDRLWRDCETARAHRLPLVHLPSEPLAVRDLVTEIFHADPGRCRGTDTIRYDMRSRHAAVFGGRDGYVVRRPELLRALEAFVAEARRG